ncbi:unnamed protein product [Blepharisma stoltei]|uniref:Uncharacterized protein n=1 Tax=Blepharisma stoltei TaxID=1481888 RepID=A0AAU9JMC7_9CILI|nr:unnamed protein product [Blepharisma stoltei]
MNSNMPHGRSTSQKGPKIDFIKKNRENIAKSKQRSRSSQALLKSNFKSPSKNPNNDNPKTLSKKSPKTDIRSSSGSVKQHLQVSSANKENISKFELNKEDSIRRTSHKDFPKVFTPENVIAEEAVSEEVSKSEAKLDPIVTISESMQIEKDAALNEISEKNSQRPSVHPDQIAYTASEDMMIIESPNEVHTIIFDYSTISKFKQPIENLNEEIPEEQERASSFGVKEKENLEEKYSDRGKSLLVIEVDENMDIKQLQPNVVYTYSFEVAYKPVLEIENQSENEEKRVSITISPRRESLKEWSEARSYLNLLTTSVKKRSIGNEELKRVSSSSSFMHKIEELEQDERPEHENVIENQREDIENNVIMSEEISKSPEKPASLQIAISEISVNAPLVKPIVVPEVSIIFNPSPSPKQSSNIQVSPKAQLPTKSKLYLEESKAEKSPYSTVSEKQNSYNSPIDERSSISESLPSSSLKDVPNIRRSSRLAMKKIEKEKAQKKEKKLKRKRNKITKKHKSADQSACEIAEPEHHETHRSKRYKRC